MKSNLEDVPLMTSRKPRRNRSVIAAAIVLLLLVGGYFAIGRFASRILETDQLRHLISARTGRQLDGNTGLHPLTARGFWVHSLGMVVSAPPPRALSELRAYDLSASFSLLELWRGKWRLDHIDVRHFQVAYGPQAARLIKRDEFATPELVPPAQDESVMGVDIRKVSLQRADLFWADPQKDGGEIRDAAVNCFPDGKNLTVHGRGGTFREAKWPEARIETFKLYYAKPSLRIDEGHLALGDRGTIDVHGQFQFAQTAAIDLQLDLAHCPIAPFLTKDNQRKIDGTFVADAHLEKQVGKSEGLSTSGKVALESAILKNIGALEKAATFTGDARLNPLHMKEARADYRFESGKLTVRGFRAEAPHVLRVEGNFTYTNGDIDGRFQLGIAPELAAKFPGAREEVFTRAQDDYLWTTVKVTGPLDHPNDDLKPRLIAALEKHVALGLLAPIVKPGQAAREVLELIFPK
jgi:hypothetical protein